MKQDLKPKPHIVAIVGPTASGKSEYAVKLAKKLGGEIISVDSRQIYRGMDIGTGKVAGSWITEQGKKYYSYKNIIHYGIDIASPKKQYAVTQFQKYANRAITQILKKGKIPILCGGTAHWMDAVIYDQSFPTSKPDSKYRKSLEKLSVHELYQKLSALDPDRASDIDPHNPRRLIRALEIIHTTGKVIPKLKQSSPYEVEWLGLNPDMEKLQEKINHRLKQRIRQGMFQETEKLHKQGVSWQKLWNYGLEYRYASMYLQKKIDKQTAVEKLQIEIRRYAKRQLTWWKRNPRIKWI